MDRIPLAVARLAATGLLLLVSGAALLALFGGLDRGGLRAAPAAPLPLAPPPAATATPGCPTCTFVPGVTDRGNHCDDCTTVLTLPFPVQIFDQAFSTANVGSNGNLQFLSTRTEFVNTCLPAPTFNTTLFP